jgi:molybdopterin converting factor small subunit
MATLKIPPILRTEAGGVRLVEVGGGTVREALGELVAAHPALESRIFDDGALPSFLNVFVDGDDIRLHAGLDTAIAAGSTIVLLPAVAGGCEMTREAFDLPVPSLYPGSVMRAVEMPLAMFSISCAQSG